MKKSILLVNSNLSEKTNLTPKDICLCGLSGGQDSVFLFIILLHLKNQWNIKIKVLHFHHFWQQKNFFYAQQVWQLNFLFKNPFYLIPSEIFLDTEKKARQWRQNGFHRIGFIENSNKIVTGHTASDRIETAIWHLLRGTSPQGLLSLKWQTLLLTQPNFFNFPKFFLKKIKVFGFFCYKVKKEIPLMLNKYSKTNAKTLNKQYIYKKAKNKKRRKINLEFLYKGKSENMSSFFCLGKKKQIYKISNYKKLKKTTQNFSFFIFNDYMFTTLFFSKREQLLIFEKKQEKTYSFLFFNFFFYKNNILRPMLVFHRNDITFFIKKHKYPILSDPSNQKLCWPRNRIRYQLLPLVKFFFNPNTEYVLNNFLEISSEEQKYIEFLINKIIKDSFQNQQTHENFSYLEKRKENKLQFFPKCIQRRLLQKIFQYYTNLQPNLFLIDILRFSIEKHC